MRIHEMQPQKKWLARDAGQPVSRMVNNHIGCRKTPQLVERRRRRGRQPLAVLKVQFVIQRADRAQGMGNLCQTPVPSAQRRSDPRRVRDFSQGRRPRNPENP